LSKNDSVQKEDVFFYLDAHWGKDLPLRDELEIIFKKWKNPIVMVDDFEVPGTDYGFDDYGPDKSLSLSYIEPIVLSHELCVLFPSITSVEESGAKRGCVILCREDSYKRMASGITTLVRYKPDH
jgi:hypothetical protein